MNTKEIMEEVAAELEAKAATPRSLEHLALLELTCCNSHSTSDFLDAEVSKGIGCVSLRITEKGRSSCVFLSKVDAKLLAFWLLYKSGE